MFGSTGSILTRRAPRGEHGGQVQRHGVRRATPCRARPRPGSPAPRSCRFAGRAVDAEVGGAGNEGIRRRRSRCSRCRAWRGPRPAKIVVESPGLTSIDPTARPEKCVWRRAGPSRRCRRPSTVDADADLAAAAAGVGLARAGPDGLVARSFGSSSSDETLFWSSPPETNSHAGPRMRRVAGSSTARALSVRQTPPLLAIQSVHSPGRAGRRDPPWTVRPPKFSVPAL